MQYDQKQFTQKGLNMFTSALSQKQPIVIDKVIVDDLPTNNFSNLALLSMDSFADALSYQANYTTVNGNLLTVDAVMSNKDFNSSYTINEVGLVGHINNDMSSQALIAVLVASDPFTLPAQQSGETPSQFIPNITLSFGDNNMNQVPVMVSDSAYIAQKDLDRLISEYNYLKIGDADNRYVKQQDFNNEVNGAVNEKADKSYVDQNINQTNNEVSQKANQSDLNDTNNELNSHFGTGEIQNGNNLNTYTWDGCFYLTNVDIDTLIGHDGIAPGYQHFYGKMLVDSRNGYIIQTLYDNTTNMWYRYVGNSVTWHHVATDDNVSTINSRIDSLNNGKNDKVDSTNKFDYLNGVKADAGDTQGRINQTLSQATAHSDQNYNDLSNKNNILSSRLEDYQKPNLVDNSYTNFDTVTYGFYETQIASAKVEKGKTYQISMDYDADWNGGNWKGGTFLVYFNDNIDYSFKFNPNQSNSNFHPTNSYVADSDNLKISVAYFTPTPYSFNYGNLQVTETSAKIPFEIAENNKQIQNGNVANKDDLNSTKTDLTNKTNDLSNTMNQQFSQANAYTDQQIQSHHATGMIKSGDNLDSFTASGSYTAYGINLGSLEGNKELPTTYNGFYGIMVVDTNGMFTIQSLYDNVGNAWFRYVGNGTPWQQINQQAIVEDNEDNARNTAKSNPNQLVLYPD